MLGTQRTTPFPYLGALDLQRALHDIRFIPLPYHPQALHAGGIPNALLRQQQRYPDELQARSPLVTGDLRS